MAHVATVVPATSPGRSARCCDVVPTRASASTTTFTGRNGPGWSMRPSSSATIATGTTPAAPTPAPPYSSGANMPNHPREAAVAQASPSKPEGDDARSLIRERGDRDATKDLVASRSINSSDVASTSTPVSLLRSIRRRQRAQKMLENSNDCKLDDEEAVEALMTDQQRTPDDTR